MPGELIAAFVVFALVLILSLTIPRTRAVLAEAFLGRPSARFEIDQIEVMTQAKQEEEAPSPETHPASRRR